MRNHWRELSGLRRDTYSLRKHLRVVRLGHLADLLLGRLRVDNLVLPLHAVLDLFPKLLFNHLVLLQQRREARLARLDLRLLRTVPLGELEQLLDLVLALFALEARLVVELRRVRGRLGIGRRLSSACRHVAHHERTVRRGHTNDCW